MAFQEIDFRETGLDTDSDLRTMNPGDSDERLNCILDVANDKYLLGNIQNDYGFLLQSYNQPTGDNEVIGSCKDYKRGAIIFFVWNSLQKHEIRRYFVNTGVVELILQSNILNFQKDYKIYHANVLEDSLSWTDGYQSTSNEIVYNSPRQISISKALGYTNGQAWPTGYTNVDLQVIEAVKYPCLYAPSFSFVSIPDFQSLLIGKYHQFFIRYTYFDNAKSIFSPFTPLAISQNEDANGNYDFSVDNAIDVTFQTGHFTVTKIEIGAKINNAYYLVDTLEKYDVNGNAVIPSNSLHTYRYLGDRQLGVLAESEVLKTQEYLPQVAACQEVVMSNTLVYANIIEGQQTPSVDLTASVKMRKPVDSAPLFSYVDYGDLIKYREISFKRLGIYRLGIIYKKTQGYHAPVASPDGGQVQIPWWKDPNTYNQYFDPNDQWILSLDQKPYIEWNINSIPPIWADSYEIVCTKDLRDLEKTIMFPQWGAAIGDKDGVYQAGKTSIKLPASSGYSFEDGDRVRLVAQYNSATLLGLATPITAPLSFGVGIYPQNIYDTYTSPSGTVYDFAIQEFDQENLRLNVAGEIIGLDPTITYLWEIYNPTRKTTASADGGQNGEIFYGVGQTYPINNPGQPNRSHSISTGIIEGIDVYHRWKKIVWDPQLVKFRVDKIASPFTPPSNPPNCSVALQVGNMVTGTAFQYSVAGIASPVQAHLNDTTTSATLSGFKDEKYGTSFNGNWSTFNMYYEPASQGSPAGGTTPNVIVDSTIINVLTGNLVGQNAATLAANPFNLNNYVDMQATQRTVSASVINWVFNGGQDTFIEFYTRNNIRLNEIETQFNIFVLCEDHSISDFYLSDFDSVGKGYIENDAERRLRYPTNLRHGGKFFEESSINNFTSFDAINFDNNLSNTYNEITRIRYIGYTLNIRQKNKSNSMYIGRTQLENTDGTSNLSATDRIFGTINPAIENWGSFHPGADMKSDKSLYYFDVTNGVVVRDSANGQIAISSYRMSKFFREVAAKIRRHPERYQVLGVWDEYINCYILTVRRLTLREGEQDDSFTLIFNDPKDDEVENRTPRWKSFMSYVPEWYENLGDAVVSFKNGQIWRHYADSNNRNTYYGIHYPQKVSAICNIGPNTKKQFTNIDLDSNIAWEADITIPPTSTYPQGMKSRLKSSKFVSREGKFSTSFMKDMNDPRFQNQTLALVNGRELRGEVIKILLVNDSQNLVYLRQVIVHLTPSELTT